MLKLVARLTTPAALTNLLGVLTIVANTVIAARMNDNTKLAAVGLSNVCWAMLVLSVIIGLNSGLETLASQAFGYGNLELCGMYFNRGRAILTLVFTILVLAPALFGEQILIALGQDAEVSKMAHTQILLGIPGIFCFGHYDLYKRWLSCMRITFFPFIAMVVATILHVPIAILFVYQFNMDI